MFPILICRQGNLQPLDRLGQCCWLMQDGDYNFLKHSSLRAISKASSCPTTAISPCTFIISHGKQKKVLSINWKANVKNYLSIIRDCGMYFQVPAKKIDEFSPTLAKLKIQKKMNNAAEIGTLDDTNLPKVRIPSWDLYVCSVVSLDVPLSFVFISSVLRFNSIWKRIC